MTKAEKREFVEGCKRNANTAKERLIDIMQNLECVGADREAAALEKIIIKLEVWQNR